MHGGGIFFRAVAAVAAVKTSFAANLENVAGVFTCGAYVITMLCL